MARDTTKRASTRTQVESSFDSPGLAVAAHNTALPTPNREHRPRMSPDMALLTKALYDFIPTATHAAREEADRKERSDYLAGQAARLQATEEVLNDPQAYLQAQTVAYTRGFMYAHGKAMASDLSAQMQLDWADAKDSLITPGQYDKWAANYTNEALQGVDDADFTQGFLESFSRTDQVLREKTAENNYIAQQQQASASLIKGYKGELAGLHNEGATLEDIHTSLQAWRDNARQLGVSNQMINEQQFETVRELAIETMDISLFDVFERESADVDNPDRMIPGMANSPDWQAKIFDAKSQVARAISAQKTEANEVLQYNTRNQINDDLLNERWASATQRIAQAVRDDIITGEAGAAMHKEVLVEQKNAREYAQAMDFARTGDWVGFERTPGGTIQNKRKALREISDERWKAAGADPIKQQQALAMDMEMSAASGEKLDRYAEALRWPPGSRNFPAAYAMYQSMRLADPAAAESYLTENQSRQFNVYQTALRGGFDEQEAQTISLNYGTKEAIDRAKDQFRQARRDHEEYIREGLVAIGGMFGDDAADEAKVVATVDSMMMTHLLYSGGNVTIEDARDWAIQRFKDTHTVVKKPGTDEVTYMRNGIGAPPADLEDAVDFTSKKLQEEFTGTAWHDEKGYYIDRSPDGDYIVYRASNNLPIPSGKGIMRFKDLSTVINSYRESQYVPPEPVDAEALKQEHELKQARKAYTGQTRHARRDQNSTEAERLRILEAQKEAREKRARLEAQKARIEENFKDRTEPEPQIPAVNTNPKRRRRRNR